MKNSVRIIDATDLVSNRAEAYNMATGQPAVFIVQDFKQFMYIRSEVFTAVTMKNAVFWDVTPCGSFKNRLFVAACVDLLTFLAH
jgi:hypothetical protein